MQQRDRAGAGEMARALLAREVRATDLVEACLERIEALNPVLNAVVTLRADAARREALEADARLARGEPVGPLDGVPITLKDSLDTAGTLSTWGTPGRSAFVPERDATVAARLKSAGAILLGKTNTPELTMGFESDNPLHGRTCNPYDPSRTSGGSSGGAACIVAAGGVPLDIGSDTGGSVRVPAHFCGCVGLRPTSGRVPRTGHAIPFGGLLDALTTLGPLARRVEDLELALRIIAGPDGVDPHVAPVPLLPSSEVQLAGVRVAVHEDNGVCPPEPEVGEAVRVAADHLSAVGCRVEEARPPGIEETEELFRRLLLADGGAFLRGILAAAGTAPEDTTLRGFLRLDPIDAGQLAGVVARWDRLRSRLLGFLRDFDAILCPVSAIVAPPHGAASSQLAAFSYTMTWNLAGWPAAAVRAGTASQGLPIGVQLVASPWREDRVLALARALEAGLGDFPGPALRA